MLQFVEGHLAAYAVLSFVEYRQCYGGMLVVRLTLYFTSVSVYALCTC
jgi:hypothetical protein